MNMVSRESFQFFTMIVDLHDIGCKTYVSHCFPEKEEEIQTRIRRRRSFANSLTTGHLSQRGRGEEHTA